MMLSAIWIAAQRAGIIMSIMMTNSDTIHIAMRKGDKTIMRKMTVKEVEVSVVDVVQRECFDMIGVLNAQK